MEESAFNRHLQAMLDAPFLAVDTETTGKDLIKDGRDYCIGISVAYRLGPLGIMSVYVPVRHTENNVPKEWLDRLFAVVATKPIVFHNIIFDLHSFKSLGLDLSKSKFYCTVNIQHMLDEELFSKALDYLGLKYFKQGKDKSKLDDWVKLFGWGAHVPVSVMDDYACRDAEITLRLFERLWPQMKEEELVTLWPVERRFSRLLFDIEQRGVGVNLSFCEAKSLKGRDRMLAILDELDVDGANLGPNALSHILFDELGLPVLKYTPKGKPCFDKKVMEEYDDILSGPGWDDNPTAKLILEYRGWQKAVSSLYESMIEKVSPDGRVRPDFKPHGTKTGRLSCSKPNLQQIPRKSDRVWNGDAKQAFVAEPGWELWGYDYAQLEFRLAAVYGQESWLIDEFAKPDGDVFTAMTDKIGAKRQTVKTYTYATIYGAGEAKIALTLGRTVAEIHDTYTAFKESIAGIVAVSKAATRRAESRQYVKYWTGRRRHFPRGEGAFKAFNSLLQGGGAELVKQAMINIDDDDQNIPHNVCRIVLQVHDEIVFEIKEGYRDKVESHIIKHMTNFPQFGVNLSVEGKLWNA